jgi:DNA mismatch repair protein MutS
LRVLRDDSRGALAALQLDLAQRHSVASLKIRHHQQLGYVIEVPLAAAERLRATPGLVLRQSMANGARFSDPELAALDQRITEAAAQAEARERGLFGHLVRCALDQAAPLAAAATALACLDVAQSCAKLAETARWCRPAVTDGTAFCIEEARHPVVEAALAGQTRFIANRCDLSPPRRLLLLTGPNMAGKSTYLRQNALIVLLAQAGLPVPAASAQIGVVDRLFCRVGASDDLARGRSTFMVEMIEAAAILTQATPRSLIIIDEIGRGTATLDGLAIAWAMLEALHNQSRARTIFATHFHELARLRHELPHLCPHTMRVKEWRGDVVFLHEVAEGAGGRSWGVQVAKLAGVPAPVVRRAATILTALETRGAGLTQDVELPLFADAQSSAIATESLHLRPILAALSKVEPDQLTPKQALEALYHLKSLADAGDPPSVTPRTD